MRPPNDDAQQAQRRVLLWAAPVIPDGDIADAIGIPPSLWAALKSQGDTPPLFLIGRRLFVRTEDLRAWLDAKARSGKPGSKRLRNASAALEDAPVDGPLEREETRRRRKRGQDTLAAARAKAEVA